MENKIGLAGDWHGNLKWQKHALYTLGEAGVKTVLHVGDYGLGWPGNNWAPFLDSAQAVCRRYEMNLYITPGNHENYDYVNALEYSPEGYSWITKNIAVMRRNTILELPYSDDGEKTRIVHSLGGANSIDYLGRVQGVSWWKDESITYGDVIRAREVASAYENGIDIMVAHDAPDGGTDEVQYILDNPDYRMWTMEGLAYAGQGRAMMNHAESMVRPRVFVHGHFHVAGMKSTPRTFYVALACDGMHNNLALLDLNDLSTEWLPILLDITEVEKQKKDEDSERRRLARKDT